MDLDQATFENGESKERVVARELSLQMKLDYFQDVSLWIIYILKYSSRALGFQYQSEIDFPKSERQNVKPLPIIFRPVLMELN